ncbi:D-inositol-3-phosphate glycosyltransferase [Nakamurella endophytica]|uniref:D-inositol-3-phosphate glycosyltransferase n=1 Tax=Nakamurella endophytica TaxID=1748367 RepID=A0A917WMG5_9ACTN|nr:D-inositol-3-phosphate glycosyltransferase [Nakamurella endophytica]
MLCLHTSPLELPGTGDAGGMNVYVAQTARRLAQRSIEVEIFTRATSSRQPPSVQPWPGVTVRHVVAGPFEGLAKDDLPGQLCSFAAGVLRAGARREPGAYSLVHSHYWLSGQVGYLVKDRWGVPLVHSAHTLARVKNLALATGDRPEPAGRVIGEDQVLAEADRLVANTGVEADQLRELYGADPSRVDVVPPGVDTDLFTPGSRAAARAASGLPADEVLLVFAGRLQPLKAPDLLIRVLPVLLRRYPGTRFRVVVAGGTSGSGHRTDRDLRALAGSLGVVDLVELRPPMPPEQLVQLYRAADAVVVPSHNESFGLVALEAQAAGTPVVAAAVGGLPVAVADGVSGVLVRDHDLGRWADAIAGVVLDPARRAALAAGAVRHAARFSWEATVDGLLETYRRAVQPPPGQVGDRPGRDGDVRAARDHGRPDAVGGDGAGRTGAPVGSGRVAR